MQKPKVLILRTAGTNCDVETDAAFQLAGAETALIHIQNLISGKIDLAPTIKSLPFRVVSPTATIFQRAFFWQLR